MVLASAFEDLMAKGDLIPLVAIVGGLGVGAIAVIMTTVKAICVAREREQTKREISAYVAEGSLDPDQAVAILKADRPKWEVGSCCTPRAAKT